MCYTVAGMLRHLRPESLADGRLMQRYRLPHKITRASLELHLACLRRKRTFDQLYDARLYRMDGDRSRYLIAARKITFLTNSLHNTTHDTPS